MAITYGHKQDLGFVFGINRFADFYGLYVKILPALYRIFFGHNDYLKMSHTKMFWRMI